MNLFDNISNVSFQITKDETEEGVYWFKQNKDTVIHAIFTEALRKNHFEINFGILKNNKLMVLKKTKNHKAIRTFNTLVIIISDFISSHPDKFLVFAAPVRSRNNFYQNRISKFLEEFEADFDVWGIHYFGELELNKEKYKPNRYYDEIIVCLKKSN